MHDVELEGFERKRAVEHLHQKRMTLGGFDRGLRPAHKTRKRRPPSQNSQRFIRIKRGVQRLPKKKTSTPTKVVRILVKRVPELPRFVASRAKNRQVCNRHERGRICLDICICLDIYIGPGRVLGRRTTSLRRAARPRRL